VWTILAGLMEMSDTSAGWLSWTIPSLGILVDALLELGINRTLVTQPVTSTSMTLTGTIVRCLQPEVSYMFMIDRHEKATHLVSALIVEPMEYGLLDWSSACSFGSRDTVEPVADVR
jgi:hypothetical protein